MAKDELRKEVQADFGDFLASHGFREIFYEYNAQSFGNEILQFENDAFGIQFVRDRSQVGIDLKRKSGVYEPIHLFLEQLGLERPPFSFDSFPKHLFGYDLLAKEWPRLSKLLADG